MLHLRNSSVTLFAFMLLFLTNIHTELNCITFFKLTNLIKKRTLTTFFLSWPHFSFEHIYNQYQFRVHLSKLISYPGAV